MRENVRDRDRLEHIVEAIDRILSFALFVSRLPNTLPTPTGTNGRKTKWLSQNLPLIRPSCRLPGA